MKLNELGWKIKSWWYNIAYGVDLDDSDSMQPVYGLGKFVSVFQHGPYIDVIAHNRPNGMPTGTIRIIPYQPNHGVMIEHLDDCGEVVWRRSCSYDMLYAFGTGAFERNRR